MRLNPASVLGSIFLPLLDKGLMAEVRQDLVFKMEKLQRCKDSNN